MATTNHHSLIILGSGPAGYTAAIYATRANLHPALITGPMPGGQLTTTSRIDNWPGAYDGITGSELMEQMHQHAIKFKTAIISDIIVKANLRTRPFILTGESGALYSCNAVIIATGASAKYLGLPSEAYYLGKGVSACAVCDGFFYRQKPVAVVGGGSSAIEEALYLTTIVSHVTIIHRRDEFRAEKILVKQLMEEVNSGRITIEWNHVVDEILGDGNGVTGLRLKNTKNASKKEILVHGVFIAIGNHPNTDVFREDLTLDEQGYIITAKTGTLATATNIAGVFAAGDVANPTYRQAVIAAASGCMAALDVKRFLE